MAILEEEKDKINRLKKSQNSIYSRFRYQLPTMSLLYKARSVQK